jgi:hypothetical protein
MKISQTILAFVTLLLVGCNSEVSGSLIPDTKGPWDGTIYMASSEDGLNFEGKTLLFEQAGVPNLLKLQNNDLVLTYQYFSGESKDMFDVIAYSYSDDNGENWTEPKAVKIEGLPSPEAAGRVPMDPTLVQLEDGRLRLYFTFHAKGNKSAALYSATASDSNIDSIFSVETTPALLVNENLLDPAVVFFDGLWHHYSWRGEDNDNYHSTSKDGLSFTRQDDINLEMDFLGQVIPFEDGLRFYGTGKGVVSAFSSDGYNWKIDKEEIVQGADPAVQQLNDGNYLMVYTSMNFNE